MARRDPELKGLQGKAFHSANTKKLDPETKKALVHTNMPTAKKAGTASNQAASAATACISMSAAAGFQCVSLAWAGRTWFICFCLSLNELRQTLCLQAACHLLTIQCLPAVHEISLCSYIVVLSSLFGASCHHVSGVDDVNPVDSWIRVRFNSPSPGPYLLSRCTEKLHTPEACSSMNSMDGSHGVFNSIVW